MCRVIDERFDLDLLDAEDPFEIDAQAAHLFKHPHLGIDDINRSVVQRPPVLPRTPSSAPADVRRDRWPCAARSARAITLR